MDIAAHDSGIEASSSPPVAATRGVRLIIGMHLVLGMAPLLSFLGPPDIRFLPVIWALGSVSIGQLMLLSFWVGMGLSRGGVRLIGGLLGIAYVTLWPMLSMALSQHSEATTATGWIGNFLSALTLNGGLVLLFAGVFLLMRRSVELRWTDQSEAAPPRARFQFSILHLLVITSIVAVVLGLVRSSRNDGAHAPTEWQAVAVFALGIVVFSVNAVCAARAALATGPVGLKVFLVLLVAFLLGVALSTVMGNYRVAWWLFPCSILVTVLPTAIVLASLLMVRTCGYRLLRKGVNV